MIADTPLNKESVGVGNKAKNSHVVLGMVAKLLNILKTIYKIFFTESY